MTVDINELACEATLKTAAINHAKHIDSINADLTSCLAKHFKADIILFNPPYVPSPPEELLGKGAF